MSNIHQFEKFNTLNDMSKSVSKEEGKSIFDFFSNFDKSSQLAYIISRFYYQIIGIYFPAVIFVTFFYFYYVDYLSSIYTPVTEWLNKMNNWYLTVVVFIGIVVITGESINAISFRLSFLSPGSIRIIDKFKKIIGLEVKPSWLYKVEWPIWFGIANYPIAFSSFDRYYLESLDKEKRSLAGKIGWITFFRNMFVVFLIIFLLQVMLFVSLKTSISSILTQNMEKADITALPDFIIHPGKTFFIPLILPLVLSLIFYLGYKSNRRSYDLVFWVSYRRNEYIKWFEAKYGSLQNVFNINSTNLTQAIDFVTDILYYSSDQYLKNFSSIILSILENSYKRTKEILDNSTSNTTCSYHIDYPLDKRLINLDVGCSYCRNQISDVFNDTKTIMSYCYKEWRDGSHELVLEKCFVGLEWLNGILEDVADDEKIFRTEFWQEMRGYLLLAENFTMIRAIHEITDKLTKWDWINKAADSANLSTHGQTADIYYNMNRNLAISYDDWYKTITSLERYFEKYSIAMDIESEAFDQLKNSGALRDFGGYDYKKSMRDLHEVEKKLNTAEYSWHEIIISYSKQWALIEMENDSIKIVPIDVTGNGKIDIWSENNPNMISNTSELYHKNHSKIEKYFKSNVITSEIISYKEISVMDSLASLIIFSYRKADVQILGYQILFSSEDKRELFFIKFEEEEDKPSSVDMFETLIHSLKQDVEVQKEKEPI
jgi:hypothetical protein